MADKKRTQRDFYNDIIALAEQNDRADIVEFAKGRIEVLDKKTAKTDSKKAEEVEQNIALVLDALSETDGNVTVSELIKGATNEIAEWSGQKVSAYLKKLCDDKRVVKTIEKKVSRFSVA